MDGAYLAIVAVLLGGGLLGALVSLYKARPERDVSVSQAYSQLVGDLRSRIEDLEEQLDEERTTTNGRLAALQSELVEERRTCAERIESLSARIRDLEARA